MWRKASAVIALFSVIASLAGCSGGDKAKTPDLAGTWKNTSRPATKPGVSSSVVDDTHASMVFTLKPDNKFQLSQTTLGATMTMEGTWSLNDHTLAMSVEKVGGPVTLPDSASPVGKQIPLILSDDGKQLIFQRAPGDDRFIYEKTGS